MTRNFRLGLFVSMAAALGLHARPCWTCCWIPTLGSGECCDPVAEPVDDAAEPESPALLLTAAVTPEAPLSIDDAATSLPAASIAESIGSPAATQRTRRARPMLRKMWRAQASPPGELGFPSAE